MKQRQTWPIVQFTPGTAAVAAVCFSLLLLAGCGQGDRPPLGTVHGVVTLDGKPMAGACVAFQPTDRGRASMAVADADGRYELLYIREDKGAKVGAHSVQIRPAKSNSKGSEPMPSPRIPSGGLKAEVKPGDNTLDFHLTTK